MEALIILFLVSCLLIFSLTEMALSVRCFRYELFRIRDEVRYSFIRELESSISIDDRKRLREQFISIQTMINEILDYPTSWQYMLLITVLDARTRKKCKKDFGTLRQFPMSFRRQLIILAMTMAKHSGIGSFWGFVVFLLRVAAFRGFEKRAFVAIDQGNSERGKRLAHLFRELKPRAKGQEDYVFWASCLKDSSDRMVTI